MMRIGKQYIIALIFMLITGVFLSSNLAYSSDFSNLRPPLRSSPISEETIDLLQQQEDRIQQLIAMDISEIPRMSKLGEKSYKLLKMVRAGLNIPPFFIIVGDGSGKITINEGLRKSFNGLQKPVIVRSSHKDEGVTYSFSGVFDSYGDVYRIESTSSEIVDIDDERFWEEGDYKIESLQTAYKVIVEGASEGYRVGKYLKDRNITDFNPNDMNVVVMEQREIDVFGMFITANQNNPDEILIHYQIRDRDVEETQSELEGEDESSKETGGVIVYSKKTHALEDNAFDAETRNILVQFGEIATQIENMFGIQIVELAGNTSNGEIYVFQSRDINLAKPEDAPRLAHYKTMSMVEDLHVVGYGYFYLPVLIIDTMDNINPTFRESEQYKELEEKYKAIPDGQKEEKRKTWSALTELIESQRDIYKQEFLRFQEEHPEYILVIKDAEDVVFSWKDLLFRSKQYDFLNQLISKAKAVIRSKRQNAIRHEDWDNVESGAINITIPEMSNLIRYLVPRKESYDVDFDISSLDKVEGNRTIQMPKKIATGDYLNILSNIDGLFIWYGIPLNPSLNEMIDFQKTKQRIIETGN